MDATLSKSEREMLKAIYRLTKGGSDGQTGAIAEHLSVSPGTVTGTVKRLAERHFVDHRPYKGVELTPEGRHAAVAAIRRHRIVERFLSDMLGYPWNEADRLAGAFEHDLPEEIEHRLFERLGRPTTCPHGFPIPDAETDRISQIPTLLQLAPGESGVIALSGSTNVEIVEFLDSLGIRPGARVEVVEKHPFDGPVVVLVEGEHRTVGERLAEKIFVKPRNLVSIDGAGRPEIEPVDARNIEFRDSRADVRDLRPTEAPDHRESATPTLLQSSTITTRKEEPA
jgi:DtxR family transcriptional regulator, Mn-dependent transcriptional regulator